MKHCVYGLTLFIIMVVMTRPAMAQDTGKLRWQCNGGSIEACTALHEAETAAYQSTTDPLKKSSHGSSAIYAAELGCDNGGSALCHIAGDANRYGTYGRTINEDKAKWAYRVGCSNGDAEACDLVDASADRTRQISGKAKAPAPYTSKISLDYQGTPLQLDRQKCEILSEEIRAELRRPKEGLSSATLPDAAFRWGLAYETSLSQNRPCPPIEFSWPARYENDSVVQSVSAKLPEAYRKEVPQDVLTYLDREDFDAAFSTANTYCQSDASDNEKACFATGWLYQNGLGTPRDYVMSRLSYQRAIKSIWSEARFNVMQFYYEGLGIPRDVWRAREYAARLCRSGDGQACANYHMSVLETENYVGQTAAGQAADFFAFRCEVAPKSYGACANLAAMHASHRFGMYDRALSKHFAGKACHQGEIEGACTLIQKIVSAERLSEMQGEANLRRSYSEKKGGLGQFLSDLGKGFSASAAIGSPYTASSTVTSPSTASQQSASMRTQDRRNFDNAINAINNIGTAYNSSCPTSNPYC